MKKSTSRVLAAALMGTLLAGCSSSSTSPAASESVPPLESVTIMCNYKAVEAPNENNDMLKAIQEYTGTKLNISWVPNLSKIDKTVMKNVQTDGKQFLIPRTRYTIRAGIALRTDWLKNLGLEMPTTIQEFRDVLYAFTYNDPDGNGVADTYGLAMYDQGLKNFATQLSIYMGGPNNWQADADGNIVSEYDSEEYGRALAWFHDCYAEGLINKDFPVVNDKTSNFTDGKAGAVFLGNLEDATTTLNALAQVNPNATCDVLQILTDGSKR